MLFDDLPQRRHEFVRCSYERRGILDIIVAIEIQHHAAGFAHDERAGRDVPRLESDFEIGIHSSCGNPTQVEAGSARATEVFGFLEHRLEDSSKGLHPVALPERKSGGKDRALEFAAGRNANAPVVEVGSATTAGGEQLVAHRVIDHRMFRAAFHLLRDGNGEMRQAMQVIAGAIKRVDHPDNFTTAGFATLFAEERMVGEVAFDFPYNLGFAGMVDFADVIMPGFACYRDGFHFLEMPAHDFAGCLGRGDGNVYDRMSHGVRMIKKRTAENTRSGTPMPQPEPRAGRQNSEALLARIRVVLINTTHPGNIGATARAMKVMGLSNLHLVTPLKFPDADATALASGADDLLQHAQVHDTLESALQGCGLVLGTSARLRSLAMPQFDARTAAERALAEAPQHEVALLFGRERYGLTNDEMQRCNWLVHIDANPEYSSLNLAQAVQVLSYELRMAALAGSGRTAGQPDHEPVDGVQMERFYEHLEQTLLDTGFLNPAQPRKLMMRLRRLFNRSRPDQNEINILRGILTASQEAAGRNRKSASKD